jgi:hypothetical protein
VIAEMVQTRSEFGIAAGIGSLLKLFNFTRYFLIKPSYDE